MDYKVNMYIKRVYHQLKSRPIYTVSVLVIIIIACVSTQLNLKHRRLVEGKCHYELNNIRENRYHLDKEAYDTPFLRSNFHFDAEHRTYWEIDGLLRQEKSKRQFLDGIVLKIYTKDDRNILLTEGYLDIANWIEPNQSLPFQVRAQFERTDPVLGKYFQKDDPVRIDIYPYFTSCN